MFENLQVYQKAVDFADKISKIFRFSAPPGALNIGTEAGGTALFSTGSSPLGIQVTDNVEASGSGTLNLNSITIQIQGGQIQRLGVGTSTGIVNFNGGTLQAGFLATNLIDNTLTSINVYNGGLTVDSQGHTISITGNLSGTTGDGDCRRHERCDHRSDPDT